MKRNRPIARQPSDQSLDSSARRFRLSAHLATLLCVISLLASSSGCRMFHRHEVAPCCDVPRFNLFGGWLECRRIHRCAKKAWTSRESCYAKQSCLDDFRKGFLAGFVEVATGGNGCTPLMAPEEYWSSKFQCKDGHCRINAWFAGFPEGVKAAEQCGIGNYYKIPLAPEYDTQLANYQEACKSCGPRTSTTTSSHSEKIAPGLPSPFADDEVLPAGEAPSVPGPEFNPPTGIQPAAELPLVPGAGPLPTTDNLPGLDALPIDRGLQAPGVGPNPSAPLQVDPSSSNVPFQKPTAGSFDNNDSGEPDFIIAPVSVTNPHESARI